MTADGLGTGFGIDFVGALGVGFGTGFGATFGTGFGVGFKRESGGDFVTTVKKNVGAGLGTIFCCTGAFAVVFTGVVVLTGVVALTGATVLAGTAAGVVGFGEVFITGVGDTETVRLSTVTLAQTVTSPPTV